MCVPGCLERRFISWLFSLFFFFSRLVRSGHPTTCAAGIAILKPSAAHIGILLVHAQIEVPDALREPDTGRDAGDASAHDHGPDGATGVDRPVLDDPFFLGMMVSIPVLFHVGWHALKHETERCIYKDISVSMDCVLRRARMMDKY